MEPIYSSSRNLRRVCISICLIKVYLMIKQIKKFQIKLTPFDATKEWILSTTNNQDLLLMDDTSSFDEEPVALEFIDYPSITDTQATLNYECDIALEQQPDDLLTTRMGLNVSGLFYPDIDPTNPDKTYKRSIFYQVRTMFYNRFHDPTKVWGMDNIDFTLGKTKRKISDEIRLFDMPHRIFGDKLVPNTIVLHDNSLDVNYEITDDGFGNLIAGSNLFSRQQEVSQHDNWYQNGSSAVCSTYFALNPPDAPTLSGNVVTASLSVGTSSLNWNSTSLSSDGFVLQKSLDNMNFLTLAILSGNVTSYFDYPITASVNYYYKINTFNNFGTSSYSNVVNLLF